MATFDWPRFFIEKEKRNKVIDRIDSDKYLNLNSERSKLLTYAIALGYNDPTPIKNQDGLVRGDSFSNDLMTAMVIVKMHDILEEGKDVSSELTNSLITQFAAECANCGFDQIEDTLNSNHEIDVMKMINELTIIYGGLKENE